MSQWNTKILDELFDIGGQGLVFELIHLFTDESTSIAEKLNDAVKENKQEVLGRIAHKLKSSAASLGLKELSEQCFKLDTKHRDGVQIIFSDVELTIQKIHLSKKLLQDYKKQKS